MRNWIWDISVKHILDLRISTRETLEYLPIFFFLRQLSATDKYKGVIKSLKNNYEVFLLSLYLTLNRSTEWSKYKKDELYKWTIKKIKCTYSVCLNAYSFMTLTTSKSRIFDVSVRPWYIIGSAGPSQRSTIEVIPKRE